MRLKHTFVRNDISEEPASNLSDRELIYIIDHDFPDISGSLRMLFNRFQGLIGLDLIKDLPSDIDCPCCGTNIELIWEDSLQIKTPNI